jgi:hypothetical protein
MPDWATAHNLYVQHQNHEALLTSWHEYMAASIQNEKEEV